MICGCCERKARDRDLLLVKDCSDAIGERLENVYLEIPRRFHEASKDKRMILA